MNRQDIVSTAWNNCKYIQQKALIPTEKTTKVGACVLGKKVGKKHPHKLFVGCNIMISTSHVYHAEMVALMACLTQNYRPVEVFVTSRSKEENIHCCLDCRGPLLECNPDIVYTIFNPDGSVKDTGKIIDDCKNIMEDESGKIEWERIGDKK